MGDDKGKPWYARLPAQLAAAVVFLVALTTLAGNLVELIDRRSQPVPQVPVQQKALPAPDPTRTPLPAMQSGPSRLRLQIDRIIVHDDGSPGTTDWRFAIDADGHPLMTLEQDSLTDQQGRNVVTRALGSGVFHPRGSQVKLTVRGWRGSRLRLSEGEPDVAGEGVMPLPGASPPIIVQSDRDDAGSFEFQFSIRTE